MSCRSPYFDPNEKKEHKLEAVLTFLTVLCLLSSIFTVLAFLITVEKYNYPERPILYFGICYVMIGLGITEIKSPEKERILSFIGFLCFQAFPSV